MLISRHIKTVPSYWRIVAVPYVGADKVDFDVLLGDTKPFDVGVKVWIRQMENDDWFVFYKAENVLVYFLFWFSGDKAIFDGVTRIFEDADRLVFEGEYLNHLVGYQWRKI